MKFLNTKYNYLILISSLLTFICFYYYQQTNLNNAEKDLLINFADALKEDYQKNLIGQKVNSDKFFYDKDEFIDFLNCKACKSKELYNLVQQNGFIQKIGFNGITGCISFTLAEISYMPYYTRCYNFQNYYTDTNTEWYDGCKLIKMEKLDNGWYYIIMDYSFD
jgi:hypothetical protein